MNIQSTAELYKAKQLGAGSTGQVVQRVLRTHGAWLPSSVSKERSEDKFYDVHILQQLILITLRMAMVVVYLHSCFISF